MWLHPVSFWIGVLQPKAKLAEENRERDQQNIPGQYFHPFFRMSRSNPCCLQLCTVWELARGLRHSLHHMWWHAGNGHMIIRWLVYSPRSTFIVCLHLVQSSHFLCPRFIESKTYLGQCKVTECDINWRAYNLSRSFLESSSLSTIACVTPFKKEHESSIKQNARKPTHDFYWPSSFQVHKRGRI